jgi:hypothetical protein
LQYSFRNSSVKKSPRLSTKPFITSKITRKNQPKASGRLLAVTWVRTTWRETDAAPQAGGVVVHIKPREFLNFAPAIPEEQGEGWALVFIIAMTLLGIFAHLLSGTTFRSTQHLSANFQNTCMTRRASSDALQKT